MKRTLAIALSALALAATGAQAATQAPQPSFVDYPLVEANVASRMDARNLERSLPQPSFVDYVVIEPVASSGSSALVASHALPQPSFAN